MRHEFLIVSAFTLLAAACAKPVVAPDSEESQLADSEATSMQETLDVSEAAQQNVFGFAPSAGPENIAGCNYQRQILQTGTACGQSYDAQVSIVWSCARPDGATASGTATVATTVTPDACPATSFVVAQSIGLDRTRNKGAWTGTLAGTAAVSWNVVPAAHSVTKQVSVQLDHQVTRDGALVRHQTFEGAKSVDIERNAPGEADNVRVATGTADVHFVLAGNELQITETGITWHHDCCHPVAGSLAWIRSGNATGEGSITFGPSCGEALNGAGDALTLSACTDLN